MFRPYFITLMFALCFFNCCMLSLWFAFTVFFNVLMTSHVFCLIENDLPRSKWLDTVATSYINNIESFKARCQIRFQVLSTLDFEPSMCLLFNTSFPIQNAPHFGRHHLKFDSKIHIGKCFKLKYKCNLDYLIQLFIMLKMLKK